MNKVEIKSAVNHAMANDGVVDATEMQAIVDQAMANGISAGEILAARSLLADAKLAVAAKEATVADACNQAYSPLARAGGQPVDVATDCAAAKAALIIANNRRDAYQTLAGTFYANASGPVKFQADSASNIIVGGHKIGDAAGQVGGAVVDAAGNIGRKIGDAWHHIFQ